ncbi:uncharacterized protein LOC142790942 [Rhipicephalus microplus]|uniref:uncharacterized protein LOC142790942 n=1 Tax=Rhipicephalus microplus TaxID=6941 RepID=UPI003F6C262E
MSLAVHLPIEAVDTAEQLADQFSARDIAQLPAAPPLAVMWYPATCYHPLWTAAQVQELCCEPSRKHELEAALAGLKSLSAPGADGVTFQMLRNLNGAGRQHLLGYYNDVWSNAVLAQSWHTAVGAPILKPRKKAMAFSSYRPVSLTSAPSKVLEKVALERPEWIAGQLEFFPEQLTGFRRHRYTADSISDFIATLEDAKSCDDVAMLLLLDVESAFDSLPHEVIETSLDRLGVDRCLHSFVTAFLTGRTFRVRVGKETSKLKNITGGVPQGSVLSPFLFSLAMAGLPASLPTGTRFPACCSVYADNVALWARGQRRSIPVIRPSLQVALDAVSAYLSGIRLKVSTTKTEALLIHPLAAARRYVKQLRASNRHLPWKLMVKYLGLTIDHRLSWTPPAKVTCTQVRRVQGAISKLQRGRGCSTKLAIRLNQVSASSVLLCSPEATTLVDAGEWPLSLRLLQRALGHVDRLHRAADCRTLLERLRSQPMSPMIALCALYHQMVSDPPVLVAPPPALQQAAVSKLQQQLAGRLQVFPDGCVMLDGSAVAACVIPSRAIRRRWPTITVLGSQGVSSQQSIGFAAAGTSISFHWLPSHVGIAGNKDGDTLAKAVHQPGTPITQAVVVRDYTQARIKKLLASVHPDQRVANGRRHRCIPEAGLTRRERANLLQLRTGCVWTAAHRYLKECCASPACSRFGDPETFEHLLCACPAFAQERSRVTAAYRRHGLPATTLENLLFPSRHHLPVLRSLVEFLDETEIVAYR